MSGQASQIREHMEVVGSDGKHVGTVDKVEGDRIKLTKQDDPDGTAQHHHYLPVSSVGSVVGSGAGSDVSSQSALKRWVL